MQDTLKQIRDLTNSIMQRKFSYDMRRRFNPHHPPEDVAYERKQYTKLQHQDFFRLKQLYVENREALLSYPELTKDDREAFQSLDACVSQDLEREFEL